MIRNGMGLKMVACLVVTLLLLLRFPCCVFASGVLSGSGLCPAPPITGISQSLTFILEGGLTHPDGVVTTISGTCNMNGQALPPVSILSTTTRLVSANFIYYSSVFAGLPIRNFVGLSPVDRFELTMEYPGPVGNLTDATPGLCTISVSWKDPLLLPEPITGPDKLKLAGTAELDGTVANAVSYQWNTTENCAVVGVNNKATVTVKGGDVGSCTAEREACDRVNNCVMNFHIITVLSRSLVVPQNFLLLH